MGGEIVPSPGCPSGQSGQKRISAKACRKAALQASILLFFGMLPFPILMVANSNDPDLSSAASLLSCLPFTPVISSEITWQWQNE